MKYHICYYLNEIININDLDLNSILLDQISWESIQFMILYTKLHMMQNIYVLLLLNQMDISKKMMELQSVS